MINFKFSHFNNKARELLETEELEVYTLHLFFWINLILPYLIFDYDSHYRNIIFSTRIIIGAFNLLVLGISISKTIFSKYGYTALVGLTAVNVPALSFIMYFININNLQWLIHLFVSLIFLLVIVNFSSFIVLVGIGAIFSFAYCLLCKIRFSLSTIFVSKEACYLLLYLAMAACFFIKRKADKIKDKISIFRIFGYAIAHELCSPLASMKLYIDAMDKMPIKNFKFEVSMLINKSLKFIRVLSDGLDKSRSRAQRINKLYENFVNNSFLNCAQRKMLRDNIIDNFEVDIDQIFFFFIFNNLVKNSFEHSKKDSNLVINVTAKVLNGQKLVIYEDNGTGIDKENVSKIFNLFTTNKNCNMGLGLPFSKAIMNHFGGSIYYDTDKGGKFILIFK